MLREIAGEEANQRVDTERGKDARMRKGVLTAKNESSRPMSWNSDALEVRTSPEHGGKTAGAKQAGFGAFLGS